MNSKLILPISILLMLSTSCSPMEHNTVTHDEALTLGESTSTTTSTSTTHLETTPTIGESQTQSTTTTTNATDITTTLEESLETSSSETSVDTSEWDITADNVFDIITQPENYSSMQWYLTSESKFFNIRQELSLEDVETIRSYFGSYDYSQMDFEYTGEPIDVKFMLVLDFPDTSTTQYNGYYSVRIYSTGEDNQLYLEVYSSVRDSSNIYVANVDNIQEVLDDYIQLMVDSGY